MPHEFSSPNSGLPTAEQLAARRTMLATPGEGVSVHVQMPLETTRPSYPSGSAIDKTVVSEAGQAASGNPNGIQAQDDFC